MTKIIILFAMVLGISFIGKSFGQEASFFCDPTNITDDCHHL